jgi:hypothetical protein
MFENLLKIVENNKTNKSHKGKFTRKTVKKSNIKENQG